VPSGKRIENMSFLSRRLLQAALDIESLGGKLALQKFKLVISIAEEHGQFLHDLLTRHSFFGFARENVAISLIPKFKGMAYDEARLRIPVRLITRSRRTRLNWI